MKIGIISEIDNHNYGNRLQNYAMTLLLKDLGHESKSGLTCYSREDWINRSKSRRVSLIKSLIPFWAYKKYIKRGISRSKTELRLRREQRFAEFNKNHMALFSTVIVKNDKDLAEAIDETRYDYFIAGSDQIWNPFFAGHDYEFLTFTSEDKRLSFAASIGADELPEYCVDRYKKRLEGFRWICVREQSAQGQIQRITGRTADVVLDPTMLVKREQWEAILKKADICLPDRYCLTYFLGSVPRAVSEYSKEKHIPLVQMNSADYPDLYTIDPAEFLYMICHAECVLTDSFHAFVFALKFNKEFYVFRRNQDGVRNMFSRIEEHIDRFGLQRRIQADDILVEDERIGEAQWNAINSYFERERARGLGLLSEQIK